MMTNANFYNLQTHNTQTQFHNLGEHQADYFRYVPEMFFSSVEFKYILSQQT